MFVTCLIIAIFVFTGFVALITGGGFALGGRASEFTRECLSVQHDIAYDVKANLSMDRIYVFSLPNYFSDAQQRTVGNYRYLIKDNKVAVLSEAAQKVFTSYNEYNQFCSRPLDKDSVGAYF